MTNPLCLLLGHRWREWVTTASSGNLHVAARCHRCKGFACRSELGAWSLRVIRGQDPGYWRKPWSETTWPVLTSRVKAYRT